MQNEKKKENRNYIKDVLLGVSVGDALGVPVEFTERYILDMKPVTYMMGYGTYNQPAGTWSDDSSLTFCLAESLAYGYNLDDMGVRFLKWINEAYWTPWGNVFDIGRTTHLALKNISQVNDIRLAGPSDEGSNGNGSLMRILPLLFYIKDKTIHERFEITSDVSAITHGHLRSKLACFIYLEYARFLIFGNDKFEAYKKMKQELLDFFAQSGISPYEINHFNRLMRNDIQSYSINDIESSGYVIHSLEAAFWCLLNNNSYEETVLQAVNLGQDTDTTAAIAGGLAALIYGWESIPAQWLETLARKDDIDQLADFLNSSIST